MTQAIYTLFFGAWLAVIIAILPAACDKQYEADHTYISPADQIIIDSRDK